MKPHNQNQNPTKPIGDPVEMGKLAARVFEHPDTVGAGQYLAQDSELTSWQEMINTLNAQGHNFFLQGSSQ